MKINKWWIIAIGLFLLGAYFVRIFPDPYHEGLPVNVYEWVYRELRELIRGEH